MPSYRRIVLASRPKGLPTPENFRLEVIETPALAGGQVLVRNRWLSLDPYMRGRMDDQKSYAAAQAIGATMIGGTAGEVVDSRNPDFPVGSAVVGMLGWQEFAVSDGIALSRVPDDAIPLAAYLGVVGMPGITAWYGLNHIVKPAKGETIVVSAASGAVGSAAGQLARLAGCRVVGIAGGPAKCAYVRDELKFDACVDHRGSGLRDALRAACADGIDGVFENVGGVGLDALLPLLNPHARIALCGLVAGYGGAPIPIGEPRWLLTSRVRLEGFIVSDHLAAWPQARSELAAHVKGGRLQYRESVAVGLDGAVAAFIGMLQGANFGKQLVRLD